MYFNSNTQLIGKIIYRKYEHIRLINENYVTQGKER